jgi:hypothetical protein
MGPYPLFFCNDWQGLRQDLAAAATDNVSIALVTDPFANVSEATLRSVFDLVIPFKEHFFAELNQPVESIVSKSHQQTVRRALKKVAVQVCADPVACLDNWLALFETLKQRHGISGLRAFSRRAFSLQLAIPGMVAFEAREIETGALVGMDLWYVQDDVAYGHLVACNARGYQLRASYAMKWHVLNYFSGKLRYVHLSAAAGSTPGAVADDGLVSFKRGWATGSLTNYFCGKVLDADAYTMLVRNNHAMGQQFFPAYRNGEF